MSNSTPCLIRCTYHYYAGAIHNGRIQYYGKHGIDDTAPVVPFPDKASAEAAIAEYNSWTWLLGNGEYARPTLAAVPASRAPACVKARVKAAQEAQA